eukprot:10442325-Prorocentrum_lima.AAC.1
MTLRAALKPPVPAADYYGNPQRAWGIVNLEEAFQNREDRMYPMMGRLWWPAGVREIVLDKRAGVELRRRAREAKTYVSTMGHDVERKVDPVQEIAM